MKQNVSNILDALVFLFETRSVDAKMMTRWNAISLERRVPIVHVCFVTSRCLWRIKHSPRQLTENTQSCHVETNWPITDAVSKTHQSQSTLHGAEPTNEDGDYCVLHDFGLCRPQNWYGVLGKGNGRFFWGKLTETSNLRRWQTVSSRITW